MKSHLHPQPVSRPAPWTLGLLFLALTGSYAHSQCPDPPTPPGGFAITTILDRTVTFSDNYRTRADIVYPTAPPGSCGWPLIINVHGGPSPAGKRETTPESQLHAPHGFFAIAYDVRGQGLSHTLNPGRGTKIMSLDEWIDMFEIIEWAIATYPNLVDPKRVGVYGTSQGGWHAWAAAAYSGKLPPANSRRTKRFPDVHAVVPRYINPAFHDSEIPNGTVFKSILPYLIYNTPQGWTLDQGTKAVFSRFLDNYDPAGMRQWYRSDPGRDFLTELKTTKTPVFAILSWHDYHGAPNRALDGLSAMPASTPRRIYIDTGGHGSPPNNYQRALRPIFTRQWMQRFLKDWSEPIEKGPPILSAAIPASELTTGNRNSKWRHRADLAYPPRDTYARTLYLRDNEQLSPQAPTTAESPEVIQHRVPLGYNARSWAVDGNLSVPQILAKLPLSTSNYVSDPMVRDTEIVASPTVKLFITPSSANYMVVAQLYSQRPGGVPQLLASAALGVRGSSTPKKLDLEMDVTNVVVPAGYRLHLTVKNHVILPFGTGQIFRYLPYFENYDFRVEHKPGATSELVLQLRTRVRPDIGTNTVAISTTSPAPVDLVVRSSPDHSGAAYLVLGSLSGAAPTYQLPAGPLWVAWDPVTTTFLDTANSSMLRGFLGTVDSRGRATATLDLRSSAALLPLIRGRSLTLSLVVAGAMGIEPGAPLSLEFR